MLVVNAGSSSLKLALLGDGDQTLAARELPAPGSRFDRRHLRSLLGGELSGADVAAHRIVHGGERHRRAVLIDDRVRSELQDLVELAPLHQPKSLAALAAVTEALPGVPAVACFDTAFHATIAPARRTYALPSDWNARWGLRRYGFHGLSHAWVARRTRELLGAPSEEVRLVSAHLGAGGSLCAIADGVSVATTMGFTPLEGLVMATRSGSVDPGLLLWLLERGDLSERELADVLEHRSGLLGLAGSADMREVLQRRRVGDSDATLAVEVYLTRLSGAIAEMAAALAGLDVLAFTGGIGQRSGEIRAGATADLGFLGVALDPRLNERGSGDREISRAGSAARTLVIEAREDLEMARQARALLSP